MKAARYLITRFQQGARSPSELARELLARAVEQPRPTEISAVSESKAGAPPSWHILGPENPFGPYRFGRRVETDRTWTIFHVFTGEPARYGTWTMKGLNAMDASRVLRTLNTPLTANS
ncbi:hypothetical protein JJB09_17745 [Rhizobium sp. KVB221]|uniref:Uncharacterized protein n=2 Tax=Rhizobium setariae TaxID=2801340 RepID=A0A936YNR6_9HYPH|nr:hypothetical protein [Rhizobium setariae]